MRVPLPSGEWAPSPHSSATSPTATLTKDDIILVKFRPFDTRDVSKPFADEFALEMEKTCEVGTIIQKVSKELTATDPEDKDYKMVLFFDNKPLLEFSSDFHFSGVASVDVIEVRIYSETDKDYQALTAPPQWSEQDEKRLTILRRLNPPDAVVKVDYDRLWALEEKKRQSQLDFLIVEGEVININEEGDNTKPMSLTVPTLNGTANMVFNYVSGMTGADLFKALDDFGLSIDLFQVKFANGVSILQDFDSLEAHGQHIFQIVPMLRGGGVGVRKSSLKANVKNMAMREKKDDLTSQAQSIEVKFVKEGVEVMELAKQQLATLYDRVEQNPKQVLRDLLSNVPDDVLGTGIEGGVSPLLDAYKKNRGNYRIQDLSEKVMKANFGALYDLSAEVDGLIETCGLTFDFLVHSLVMKETGEMDWSALKRVLEDSITVRNATDDL